jgi:hypothetical protein
MLWRVLQFSSWPECRDQPCHWLLAQRQGLLLRARQAAGSCGLLLLLLRLPVCQMQPVAGPWQSASLLLLLLLLLLRWQWTLSARLCCPC